MTERKRLTCPETGHLEEVELERTPLGLVVLGCSRFPDRALGCPRECARRMDRRERMNGDTRDRILLVVPDLRGQAARIAEVLVVELAVDGLVAELAELGGGAVPPLADYDAVVIGANVRLHRIDRSVLRYIREQRDTLVMLPAFFYTVGGHGVYDRETYARRMTRRTGWRPTASTTFADAEPLQRPGVHAFARQIADETPARSIESAPPSGDADGGGKPRPSIA